MDPDQFREIRLEINRLNDDVKMSVENNDVDIFNKQLNKARVLLEKLVINADGEIQVRSTKNLENKLNFTSTLIDKIKPQKDGSRKFSSEKIIWDEDRLSLLSNKFLNKLLDNMRSDTKSNVCFSTTGKGVKPSYQIGFETGETSAYSGSSHNQLKRKLSSRPGKTSQPFPYAKIKSILDGKK